MRSISIFPAYGRKWHSKADVISHLLRGLDVRTPQGYATLPELINQGYTFVEARKDEATLLTAFSLNTAEMKAYLNRTGRPTELRPLTPRSTAVPTESEARQACQNAKNARHKLEKLSRLAGRVNLKMAELRKVVADNETIVHAWETSLTEVQRRRPKVSLAESAARRKEREAENKLRALLGLPALAEGEKGML